jgi:hypothetical protein
MERSGKGSLGPSEVLSRPDRPRERTESPWLLHFDLLRESDPLARFGEMSVEYNQLSDKEPEGVP